MLASMSEPRADTPPLNWSDLGVVATSREPIGVAGEMTFVVPSLLLSDETGPGMLGQISISPAMAPQW